ncbi:MAG: site-2 protease family protein, partial [Solirubrobacterales bacterium]|nr:site-2 protease family protein [Solirubrobacterales bacterium]
SWVLAFLGFAALIVLHELGHFAAAKAVGMRVERFALFFPPIVGSVRRGETEYAMGSIPLGGYVKITGMNPSEELAPEIAHRAYFRQPVWKRIVVIVAGPVVNLVLAFLILWALFFARGVTDLQVGVGEVVPGSAAAEVLRPGDRILSIDGRPGYAPGLSQEDVRDRVMSLRRAIAEDAQTPAQVVVERDGARVAVQALPRFDREAGQPVLGFAFARQGRDLGAVAAAGASVDAMWRVTTLTVETLGRLFYDEQARDQVSGVVGNYEATRQSFDVSTVRAIELLALISLSLGIINLFPFLPLDGGHIFWALAEKLRGRPISFRVMERASVVGIVLVGILFFLGLTNDVQRIVSGEGFGVR